MIHPHKVVQMPTMIRDMTIFFHGIILGFFSTVGILSPTEVLAFCSLLPKVRHIIPIKINANNAVVEYIGSNVPLEIMAMLPTIPQKNAR